MASGKRSWEDRIRQYPLHQRAIRALFDDTSDGDGELPVVQLTDNQVYGVLWRAGEQEEGSSVLYSRV